MPVKGKIKTHKVIFLPKKNANASTNDEIKEFFGGVLSVSLPLLLLGDRLSMGGSVDKIFLRVFLIVGTTTTSCTSAIFFCLLRFLGGNGSGNLRSATLWAPAANNMEAV